MLELLLCLFCVKTATLLWKQLLHSFLLNSSSYFTFAPRFVLLPGNKCEQLATLTNVHELKPFCTLVKVSYTRGVQKVRRPTQLTTRYTHRILSLFDIFSYNWNALGPAFVQSSYSVVEEMLLLVFQSAICCADNVLIIRNFVSFY